MINKADWITQFATQFLASYAASKLDSVNAKGGRGFNPLYELPVADAFLIGEAAYDKFVEAYKDLAVKVYKEDVAAGYWPRSGGPHEGGKKE